MHQLKPHTQLQAAQTAGSVGRSPGSSLGEARVRAGGAVCSLTPGQCLLLCLSLQQALPLVEGRVLCVAVGGGTAYCHSSATSTARPLPLSPADLFGEVVTSEFCTPSLFPATLMTWRLTAVDLEMPEVLAGASACGQGHAELLIPGHLLEDAFLLLLFLFGTHRLFFLFLMSWK